MYCIKKTSLFFLLLAFSQAVYCLTDRPDFTPEDREFPPCTTHTYLYSQYPYKQSIFTELYSKYITGQEPDPVTESIITTENFLNTGITRKKITKKEEDGTEVCIEQVWTSRNSSCFTWTNGAILLVVASIVSVVVQPESR